MQLKNLTRAFGAPVRLPYVAALEGEPEVIAVLKEADERGGVFGGDWHTDFSFLERPPAGSLLAAEVIPPYGGDTVYVSQAAAFETLPGAAAGPALRARWRACGKALWRQVGAAHERARRVDQDEPGRSGRRSGAGASGGHREPGDGAGGRCYLNPLYVVAARRLYEAESRPLLEQIQRHATRPEFCCRLRWSAGAVAVWDNLFTQHYAVNDYHGHRRLMYRTTFAGPTPRELAAAGGKARAAE